MADASVFIVIYRDAQNRLKLRLLNETTMSPELSDFADLSISGAFLAQIEDCVNRTTVYAVAAVPAEAYVGKHSLEFVTGMFSDKTTNQPADTHWTLADISRNSIMLSEFYTSLQKQQDLLRDGHIGNGTGEPVHLGYATGKMQA